MNTENNNVMIQKIAARTDDSLHIWIYVLLVNVGKNIYDTDRSVSSNVIIIRIDNVMPIIF